VLALVEDMALIVHSIERVQKFANHRELVQVVMDVQTLMEEVCNFVGNYLSRTAMRTPSISRIELQLNITRENVFAISSRSQRSHAEIYSPQRAM
jgi:hypothetical protein